MNNSHCHMSYSSYNHWFRRHLTVLVGNTRTSFIFLKIFVKNSVKVRHSQLRFRKKILPLALEKRKSEVKGYLPRPAKATGSKRREELGNKFIKFIFVTRSLRPILFEVNLCAAAPSPQKKSGKIERGGCAHATVPRPRNEYVF